MDTIKGLGALLLMTLGVLIAIVLVGVAAGGLVTGLETGWELARP